MSETALLSMPFAGAVPMTASRVLGLSWYSAPGIIQRDGKPAPQIRRTKIMSDNRKYYYLKLKESYFDDDAIVLLESMQDGMLYSNILLKLYLKSLKYGGTLQLDENIPYTAQMIATITRQQVGTVERALQIFMKLGLVEPLDNGALYMSNIELFIGQSSTEGERKRRARMKISEQKRLSGQVSEAKADICPPEIEIKKEIDIEIEKERELETSYTVDDVIGKNGWGNGYTFPCLFKNEDKGWVLISETGVSSAYCGSRLLGKENGLYTIGFPQEGEYNGNGTVSPGMALPGETPWRTVTVGRTLAPIVETTVMFDVVKPLYEASQEFQYGCGTWSWIIGGDNSMNYDEQKRYIDFSADMGYSSVLVDALWDSWVGRDKIAELADYAASKGVALYLWYNSNGYWNDAPQSPRGIMNNTIMRRKEMKWMQSIGIRGIKVDFIGSDKQVTMQLYEDILADANDYGLMVIFHGCTLPRGWEL